MSTPTNSGLSRRELLQKSGTVAVASALAGVALPAVHAAGDDQIQVALVGCGGRGTGAALQALSTAGPTKLVAMADVFPDRLNGSLKGLQGRKATQVDVPKQRQFIGFDGYKKAMDSLKRGDVVILATPPAFRWPMFAYAIEKGLNVFMEKPVSVDGPSSRRMFKLAEESVKRGLKVGVGLMCRHCAARQDLYDRIKNGQIGDILLLQAYRQTGPTAWAFTKRKPKEMSELLYQVQRFHAFLWASGGAFSDFLIHNIDECCWMKDAFPVNARGSGGRHYRGDYVDQNFDTYSVEYTFKDGAKLQLEGRNISGCAQRFASYAHGTKGSAIISTSSHTPARSRIYKGHNFVKGDLTWAYKPNEPDPYQLEWDHLMDAIRKGKAYNEAKRGTEASLVTAMGRMACHTGRVLTYEQMLNCEHEMAPGVDKLTMDSPAPVQADDDGRYPIPTPGRNIKREY
jgi:predicted dehydrogenase